jgi:glycosyltransferase involved in cell wall biosynthesis
LNSSAPLTMQAENLPQVAIIARLDQPGGVQSVVLSLIRGLNAHGIRPDLVWDVKPSQELLKAKGVNAGYQPVRFPVPSRLLDRVPITARYFLTIANTITNQQISHPYDFYFTFYNGFLVPAEVPHLRYLNGPPLLPQLDIASPGLRGLPFRFVRRLYQTVLRYRFPVYEFHRNSCYVINSNYTARLFEEAHGVSLPVIHPPIDLSGHRFTKEDITQRDTITFISRFVDYKRPEMILRLADCYPQHRFVLMGGVKPQNRAFYEDLQKQKPALGRKNVFFFDNPSDRKVKEELARTLIFVFPAINEHFGMATAEAIASGAIPYVHDSGGQREIVPLSQLRFSDDQFFDRFAGLLQLSQEQLNDIRFTLFDHVKQFSEEVFIKKILAVAELNGISNGMKFQSIENYQFGFPMDR